MANQTATQQFDYFLILDFEATCDEGGLKPPEIIEFPTVLLNARTLQIEDEFHYYIKPKVHPILRPFCIELTGIQQEWVDNGIELKEALQRFHAWLHNRGLMEDNKEIKSFSIITCGDWDLEKMLSSQTKREKLTRQPYFQRFVNIKKIFQQFYKRENLVGMAGMLTVLNMELIGKHHSGIDDCRNICRIVQKMIQEGCVIQETYNNIKPPKEESNANNNNNTPCDNPELVEKLIHAAKGLVNITLLEQLKSELPNTDVTDPKFKGKLTQKVLEQLKNSEEAAKNLSAKDRKKLQETVASTIQKFISQE